MPQVLSVETVVFLAQLGTTLFMTGVIWFVQIVHYPLFDRVGPDAFARYERDHMERTGWVVAPVMLAEALTSAWMIWRRPPFVSWEVAVLGAATLFGIWLATLLIQVPCHNALARGFDRAVHRRLVLSNWIRTGLWSARALLLLRSAGSLSIQ